MSEDTWRWRFRGPAKRTYDSLDAHAQDRITDKLDEIVNDRWRTPDDYLEPLTSVPHSKLRIGQFRLGAECDYDEKILDIYTIERRSGAYKPGDD
jgi:mRNA-degrading endonuclease RelE of RelBE toxin-antitoxin system